MNSFASASKNQLLPSHVYRTTDQSSETSLNTSHNSKTSLLSLKQRIKTQLLQEETVQHLNIFINDPEKNNLISSSASQVESNSLKSLIASANKFKVQTVSLFLTTDNENFKLLKKFTSELKRIPSVQNINVITTQYRFSKKFIHYFKESNIELHLDITNHIESLTKETEHLKFLNTLSKELLKLNNNKINYQVVYELNNHNIKWAFYYYQYLNRKNISLTFSILKENPQKKFKKPSLIEFIDLLESLKNHLGSSQKVFSIFRSSTDIFKAQNIIPKIHCGAGLNQLTIDHYGWVYPCSEMMSEEYAIGNINSPHFIEDYLETRKKNLLLPFVDEISGCSTCQYKNHCGGGCRAEHSSKSHRFNSCSCGIFKSVIYFYLLNKNK